MQREGGNLYEGFRGKTTSPRGRSEEKRQSAKDVIRDVYANDPQKAVQIIPAKKDLMPEEEKRKLRVCAYCRVSTDEDSQASSYELQVQNYTKMIRENPEGSLPVSLRMRVYPAHRFCAGNSFWQ